MKVFFRLSVTFVVAFAVIAGCRKGTAARADTTKATAQDTMLLRDLAEANRNTAAAASVDNSLTTVRTGVVDSTSVVPQNRPNMRPTVPGAVPPANPGLTPPLRANDASGGTTVPLTRSPASSASARASRDPCDSPTLTDQRYCLNRSIATNDADLNRTYQELIEQARKSGGSELEQRFSQSQRDWIVQRDSDCTSQTQSQEGKLWARARARCLASASSKRTAELNRNLNSLRGQ
jgi:uncharacterized protein YecT (DUF1311 family)